jgi:hypothetical protein
MHTVRSICSIWNTVLYKLDSIQPMQVLIYLKMTMMQRAFAGVLSSRSLFG